MSFSFWIYINSNSYYTPILKTDDRNYYDSTSGWIINVGTDWRGPTSLAILQFKATGQQVYQGVTSLEDSVPAGKWNHIVAIIDNVSKIAKISINGSPNVSGSFLGEPILSSDPIILGGARWPLNGKLDEIRLFDGVLTDE